MKIFKPIGSKERFVEMFQRVNKINLNEALGDADVDNLNDIQAVNAVFDDLKSNGYNIQSATQPTDDGTYVKLEYVDDGGNKIMLRFKLTSEEGNQEDVYSVKNVSLVEFNLIGNSGVENIKLSGEDLNQFNADNKNEMFNIIEPYIDIETEESNYGEEDLAEAIKLIDAIKKQSYPFGGSPDEMQKGKNYADEKPTNDAVRVKSPELDKFIQEEKNDYPEGIGQTFKTALEPKKKIKKKKKSVKLDEGYEDYGYLNPPANPKYSTDFNDWFYNIKNWFNDVKSVSHENPNITHAFINNNGDYVGVYDLNNQMGWIDSDLTKEKSLAESTDQDKYEEVVFLQGDEAFQPLEILDSKGEDAALEYLKQWHYPGEHMGTNELPHGSSDYTYEKDGYHMSWNPRLGYIGLVYDLSYMNEELDYEELPSPQTTVKSIHRQVDDMKSKFIVVDNDFNRKWYSDIIGQVFDTPPSYAHVKVINEEDDESISQDANIEQLAQDKENTGELLQGGLGDDKSPLDFDPDQVLIGLDVEKEHTDNSMIALEIVLDHLSENPEYYTLKDNPEDSAQMGAAKDAAEDGGNFETNPDMKMNSSMEFADKVDTSNDDREMTDILLGYRPMNVGEEFDYNREERDYQANDRYKRYLQYKQMSDDEINQLSDEQSEDYFNLTDEFSGAEINEGYGRFTDEMLNQEPYLSVKNALIEKYRQDGRITDNIETRAAQKVKNYHDWIINVLKRYDVDNIAQMLYKHDIVRILGMSLKSPEQLKPQKSETQSAETIESILANPDNRPYKNIIHKLIKKYGQIGLNPKQIENNVVKLFTDNMIKNKLAVQMLKKYPEEKILNFLIAAAQ